LNVSPGEAGRRGIAERAADRAEGKVALPVADASRRRRDDEAVGPLPDAAAHALSPEENIAEAAEEHKERIASGDRGRGKI